MIRSMTAFGSATQTDTLGTVALELRSVNSRYLDLHFRLPEDIRHLETGCRERLQAALQRGKVEIRVNLQRAAHAGAANLNTDALQALTATLRQVQAVVPDVQAPRLAEVLAWPGVQAESDADTTWDAAVFLALDAAITQLQTARCDEGDRLARAMLELAGQIDTIADELQAEMPRILEAYRERQARKLHETFEAAFPQGLQHISGTEISERLAHETALFSLRIDVAEELTRLRSHLEELRQILGTAPEATGSSKPAAKRGKTTGSTGKRLDFLLQEMNREANTLGSKAGAIDMTRAALDLKLLIEQLREQAQNIE